MAIRPGQRPSARYEDPRFRLAFARIVTHDWRHNCWMDGVDLIGGASKLTDIPAILVDGRRDIRATGCRLAAELDVARLQAHAP